MLLVEDNSQSRVSGLYEARQTRQSHTALPRTHSLYVYPLLVSAKVTQVQRQLCRLSCCHIHGPLKKTQLTHPQTCQCSFIREASIHFPPHGTSMSPDFQRWLHPILYPNGLICPGYGYGARGHGSGGHRVTGMPLSSQGPHVLVPEDMHAEGM